MRTTLRQIVSQLLTLAVLVTAVTLVALATAPPLQAAPRGFGQGGEAGGVRPEPAEVDRKALIKRALGPSVREHAAAAPSGEGVSEESVKSFKLGGLMVCAMTSASLADDNKEIAEHAVLELEYLADQLKGQPEAAQLQRVLEMVVRRTGTPQQRWNAIADVTRSYSGRLTDEPRWYFNAGVSLTKLSIFAYLEDAPTLQAELKVLQRLVQQTPRGVPASILTPMRHLAQYATQETFNTDDYAAISYTTEKATRSVLG